MDTDENRRLLRERLAEARLVILEAYQDLDLLGKAGQRTEWRDAVQAVRTRLKEYVDRYGLEE